MKRRQPGVRISHMLRVGAQHHLPFRQPATRPISLRVKPHRVLHRVVFCCSLLQQVVLRCSVLHRRSSGRLRQRALAAASARQNVARAHMPPGIPCRVGYHVVWHTTSQSVPCRGSYMYRGGRGTYLKIARPVRSSTAEPSRKSMSHTRNVACAQTVRSKQPRRLWKFPDLSGPYGLACRQRPAQRCSDTIRRQLARCRAARCRMQGFPPWRRARPRLRAGVRGGRGRQP
jgi:hypothetical protein